MLKQSKHKEMELNENDIKIMRHALGINPWQAIGNTVGGRYRSHRNHYCAQYPSPAADVWEKLIECGYAERITGKVNGMVYYAVSEKGVSELGRKIGTHIELVD